MNLKATVIIQILSFFLWSI